MPDETRKRINYMVVCVNEFARKNSLSPKKAFLYLYQNKGLDFLEEHYDIEHLLSIDNAIEDLEAICGYSGGKTS